MRGVGGILVFLIGAGCFWAFIADWARQMRSLRWSPPD